MTRYLTLFLAATFMAAFTAGCQKAANSNAAVNQPGNLNSADANAANANRPVAEKTPDVATSGFSLATPTDAYKTAWAIREKKDVEGMKKVVSKDIIEFMTEIGKAEKKSLDEELKDLCDRPQAKTPETRNEKITGNTATIEYLDETGNWRTMDFIKEGSEWKLTINQEDKPTAEGPGKKK